MRTIRLVLLVAAVACDRAPSPAASSPASPSTSVAPTLVVGTPPAAPSPTPTSAGDIDPCVLGTWRLTPANAAAFYRHAMSAAGAPVEILDVQGTATVSLSPAGATTMDMSGTTVRYRMAGSGGPPVEMTLSISGSGTAQVVARDGLMTYTNSDSRFDGRVRVRVGGTEREVPFGRELGDSFGASLRGTNQYRCVDGRLELTSPGAPGPVTWVR